MQARQAHLRNHIEKSEEQWVKSEVYPPKFSLPVWKQRIKSQVTPLIWTCLLWGTKMDQKLPEEPEGKILMSVQIPLYHEKSYIWM